METHRTPPPRAAQRFNLAVSALVFAGMLAFSAWVAVSTILRGEGAIRVVAGLLIAGAALTLLSAVREAWQEGRPLQHGTKTVMGFGMLGIGLTALWAGLAS